VYGVNTGFGKLANQRISKDDLATLQLNLIRSHSVGVGEPLPPPVVRLMLALKAASLARGYSGVRPVVIDTLLAVLNAGLVPWVPCQGSVGASGDLAPLSHMTLALLGEGDAARRRPRASRRPTRWRGMASRPLRCGQGRPGADQRHADQHRAGAARAVRVRAGAGVGAGDRRADGGRRARQRRPVRPAHPRAARPAGPDRRGAVLPRLLAGSAIRASHLDGDDRVQDPYCLRCQPQVVGACLDQLRHAALVLLREANAVTDNPLVFADDGAMVSGGNFHAEPVALAADAMAWPSPRWAPSPSAASPC
jgi:histidine ammonia-lyase